VRKQHCAPSGERSGESEASALAMYLCGGKVATTLFFARAGRLGMMAASYSTLRTSFCLCQQGDMPGVSSWRKMTGRMAEEPAWGHCACLASRPAATIGALHADLFTMWRTLFARHLHRRSKGRHFTRSAPLPAKTTNPSTERHPVLSQGIWLCWAAVSLSRHLAGVRQAAWTKCLLRCPRRILRRGCRAGGTADSCAVLVALTKRLLCGACLCYCDSRRKALGEHLQPAPFRDVRRGMQTRS